MEDKEINDVFKKYESNDMNLDYGLWILLTLALLSFSNTTQPTTINIYSGGDKKCTTM